ncbi:MAG TPA: ABC transporter ATP-binding protein [Thermoplasmata archaeon]|nr:ABC transporter ATP-binding protein [Thermoplasmata archaeon]
MNAIVETKGVSKWYGEVLGLNTFTSSFGPGITGLVGPNGAGKSTLFKLLIGQLRADAGSVQLLGENPWNNVAVKSRVGYCPEHNQLYGWMTGQKFVETLLRLDGMPSAQASKAAADALEVVGLTSAAHRLTRGYSRGMRQRAKLAQALAHHPKVLVLDEPLSGADPLARVHILRTISDFARNGGHVIMSTHVLYEIERITHNIVLIHNGKAIASGDIQAIRALIDEHPHAVRLVTPRPRDLAQALAGMEHIVSFEFPSEDTLLVRTRKPDVFYKELPEAVVSRRLDVRGVESPDDSLDAVFRYLVG